MSQITYGIVRKACQPVISLDSSPDHLCFCGRAIYSLGREIICQAHQPNGISLLRVNMLVAASGSIAPRRDVSSRFDGLVLPVVFLV